MALISEDTQAIKTARPSARKTKLNPTVKRLLTRISLPDETSGIIAAEQTSEVKINPKANEFLRREEIRPTNGRINAPVRGRRISNRSIACSLIIKFSYKKLRLPIKLAASKLFLAKFQRLAPSFIRY